MAKRVGLLLLLVLGFLAGSILPVNGIFATGDGSYSNPFIVHELTMDARFMSEGYGYATINGNVVGVNVVGSPLLSVDNILLNDWPNLNTIKINSDIPCETGGDLLCNQLCGVSKCSDCNRCDDCGFEKVNDHVVGVFRVGSDTDNNIIYTQKNGWIVPEPGGGTIYEAPVGSCYFLYAGGSMDLSTWTPDEKCVTTKPAGYADCAFLSLSKTFYVKYCPCSSGPCCPDGCNYALGSICGTQTCPSDYYYQNSSSCYKANYPDSCEKTCDGSGKCQDCCAPVNSSQSWGCDTLCQQPDYQNSCRGSTEPSCINLPSNKTCGTNQSVEGYVQISGVCYYRTATCYCNKYCDGSGSCGDCSYNVSQCLYPQACGTCKQSVPGTCPVSCVNSNSGTSCNTSSGQPGTCDGSGNCILKPSLSVSAHLSASNITTGQPSNLTGNVVCSNGYCGLVYVYPKVMVGVYPNPLNTITGLSADCSNTAIYGYNCEYKCPSYMDAEQSCTPYWAIRGNIPGIYPIYLMAVNSGSSLETSSSTVTLNVTQIPTGSISAGLSLDSSTVTAGTITVARATVSCSGSSGAYCGSITFSISYNGTSGLSILSSNPQSCGEMWNGQKCYANWTINSISVGMYNVSVTAVSNKSDVSQAGDYKTLYINSAPVGVLKIENLHITPSSQKIIIGENAVLGAKITCTSSGSSAVSCGTVTSYARYNGTKIVQSGPLSVANPEINCGPMNSTSPYNVCYVNWSIRGNSAGSYQLDVTANSTLPQVKNAASDTKPVLTVSKNLGLLSIPSAEFRPQEINITNSATLAAKVNCSTSYCGGVSVNLAASPSGLSGDMSQRTCYSFPCDLSWNIVGSSEGYFTVTITAVSNESIQASNNAMLIVKGLNPLLGLASNMAQINPKVGQPVQVKATVTCHTKDCGQVTATLVYNSGGWKNLPYGSIQFTPYNQDNPAVFDMTADQSREVVWTVNFAEAGTYQIGVFANGSAANVINAVQTETINVSNPALRIDILSPQAGARFFRGDDVFLQAKVTMDGNPVTDMPLSITGLEGITFSHTGNGIYQGSGKVPRYAAGQHWLEFTTGGYESTTYILVNSTLDVTVRTDKASYSGGDNIRITGDVKKNYALVGAMVTLLLSHSSGLWSKEIRLNASGSYSYENIIAPNIDGKIKITANAEDSSANSGQSYTEFPVTSLTGDFYNISFELSKYNYSRGENVNIRVKVTDMGIPKAGLMVKCNFFGSMEMEEGSTVGLYYGSHAIPFDASIREESLACDAFGAKNGTGFVNIKVEPASLMIIILNPTPVLDIIPVVSQEPTQVKVAVFYLDNTPVTNAVVKISLADDNRTTNLAYSGIPGIYTADVIFKKDRTGAAISSIFLTAEDSQGNRGDNKVRISVDTGEFNWWWFLLIPAGLVILFILYMYLKSREEKEPPKIQIQEKIIKLPIVERVREVIYRPVRMPAPARPKTDPVMKLKDEIGRLEERSRTTQDAKDLAEQQYYKRQIDEATFNKLMQSYEEKLIELDAAIRQKKKELYGMGPR